MENDPIIHAKTSEIVEAIKNSNVYHRYEGINKCTLEKSSDEILPDEPLECSCDCYERLGKALSALPTLDQREVLEGFAELMNKEFNELELNVCIHPSHIDRYLAEKQSKTENK